MNSSYLCTRIIKMMCGLSFIALACISSCIQVDGSSIQARFEAPTIAHISHGFEHAWFSNLLWPSLEPHGLNGTILLTGSMGGDGTPCPPPGKPPQNCSLSMHSEDGGRSWSLFSDWSKHAPERVLVLPNGSFVTVSYGLEVSNDTVFASSISEIVTLTNDVWTVENSFVVKWNAMQSKWPSKLVHSGDIVQLSQSKFITTLYGHGSGEYRNWTQHSAVYFVTSEDFGRTWDLVSQINWTEAMGTHADGPAEPSTTKLSNGSLVCVFRGDSQENYWKTWSHDDGITWTSPVMLPDQWSVKPQLRSFTMFDGEKELLLLSGGRPGIRFWISEDYGISWKSYNLAAIHNSFMNTTNPSLTYSSAVVNANSSHTPRANPPETSSYTGMVLLDDDTIVISYDRLANGWSGPPGPWGSHDTIFTIRVHLSQE
eukprot:m.7309 g.7309  ORF g.7309 m.7309 type:complete len:427 (+) comp3686_c0_seq1:77-1357(+)